MICDAQLKQPECITLAEMLGELIKKDEQAFFPYAFLHEPMRESLSKDLQADLAMQAIICGREQAMAIRTSGTDDIHSLILSHGLKVVYDEIIKPSSLLALARYEPPDCILLSPLPLAQTRSLIHQENLCALLCNVDVEQILLVHELYHHLEANLFSKLFTQIYRVAVRKVWPFCRMRRIECLSEIGAMAFVKELLGLPYSPFTLDLLFAWPFGRKVVDKLYNAMCIGTI